MSSTWFLQRVTALYLAVIYLCFLLKNSCKRHPLRSVHSIVLQTKISQQPQVDPYANRKSPVLGALWPRSLHRPQEGQAFQAKRQHPASFRGGSGLMWLEEARLFSSGRFTCTGKVVNPTEPQWGGVSSKEAKWPTISKYRFFQECNPVSTVCYHNNVTSTLSIMDSVCGYIGALQAFLTDQKSRTAASWTWGLGRELWVAQERRQHECEVWLS